jgi:hypothetical protein
VSRNPPAGGSEAGLTHPTSSERAQPQLHGDLPVEAVIAPGDHPPEHARDDHHDRQRDPRLDQQAVQIDQPLVGEHLPDAGRMLLPGRHPGRDFRGEYDLGVCKAIGMAPRQILTMITCWVLAPGLAAAAIRYQPGSP